MSKGKAAAEIKYPVRINDGQTYYKNPRVITETQFALLEETLEEFGDLSGIVHDLNSNEFVGGNQRSRVFAKLEAMVEITMEYDPPTPVGTVAEGFVLWKGERYTYRAVRWTPQQMERANLVANKAGGSWDWDMLANAFDVDILLGAGFTPQEVHFSAPPELEKPAPEAEDLEERRKKLTDRFLIPPFSLFDSRQAYWQERKRNWLALGIRSGEGRDEGLAYNITSQPPRVYQIKNDLRKELGREPLWEEVMARAEEKGISILPSTSIFDPVLCEVVYSWFNVPNGTVLDPFAGGSVRGVVAGYLGCPYHGIDLRAEQVAENRQQAEEVFRNQTTLPDEITDPSVLTPVVQKGAYYLKRDDLFVVNGVNGGKVRTCLALAQGATGLVTAGSRQSPQVNIVAHVAAQLGIPARIHTPEGEISPEVQDAVNTGAVLMQHKAGYNNVIIKRANSDATAKGYREIPFGMENQEAVEQTRRQVKNIPRGVKRIVVPVGSGMSLCGILHGLLDEKLDIPVLGVQVGASPLERLNEFAPKGWKKMVALVQSPLPYEDHYAEPYLEGVKLDPVYEAKCLPFLEPGDLLWIVGIRKTAKETGKVKPTWYTGNSLELDTLLGPQQFDMVFSCPPYFDLEVYSDDPADLSNVSWDDFYTQYYDIIQKSVAQLKENRFAVFVVGDLRDKSGLYRNFPGVTIECFHNAGAALYNEIILITQAGSLPIRVGRSFSATRKVGKTHQNVYVFYKGNPEHIQQYFPKLDLSALSTEAEFTEEEKPPTDA